MKFENRRHLGRDNISRIKLPGNPLWEFQDFEALGQVHADITHFAHHIGLRVCRVYDDNAGAYLTGRNTTLRQEPLMIGSWIGICRKPLSESIMTLMRNAGPMSGIVQRVEKRVAAMSFDAATLAIRKTIDECMRREVDTAGMTIAIRSRTSYTDRLLRFMEGQLSMRPYQISDSGNFLFPMGFPYYWAVVQKGVNDLGLYKGLP